MDLALRVAPEQLVGRALRVLWPLDDAWFLCTVESWDEATGQHKVRMYLWGGAGDEPQHRLLGLVDRSQQRAGRE